MPVLCFERTEPASGVAVGGGVWVAVAGRLGVGDRPGVIDGKGKGVGRRIGVAS